MTKHTQDAAQKEIADLFLGNKAVEEDTKRVHNESPVRGAIDAIVMHSSEVRVDVFCMEDEEERAKYVELYNNNMYSVQKEERFDKVVETTIVDERNKVVTYNRVVDYTMIIISKLAKNLERAVVDRVIPPGLASKLYGSYSSSEAETKVFSERILKIYDAIFYKEQKELEKKLNTKKQAKSKKGASPKSKTNRKKQRREKTPLT